MKSCTTSWKTERSWSSKEILMLSEISSRCSLIWQGVSSYQKKKWIRLSRHWMTNTTTASLNLSLIAIRVSIWTMAILLINLYKIRLLAYSLQLQPNLLMFHKVNSLWMLWQQVSKDFSKKSWIRPRILWRLKRNNHHQHSTAFLMKSRLT